MAKITFHAEADSIDELRTILSDAVRVRNLDLVSNDEVLQELRDRMDKLGMIVQVEHFDAPDLDETPPPPPVERKTRRNKSTPATAEQVMPVPNGNGATLQIVKTDAAPPALVQHDAPMTLTKADVVAALDKYSTSNPAGQAGARLIMKTVTGKESLITVDQAQFGAIIEALSVAA